MDFLTQAVATVANADHAPLEAFDDPRRGTVQWRTLFSGDRTQTSSLTLGVAEFGPAGTLHSHRHSPCEFYFCLSGQGIVTIDGIDHDLRPGVALYIPADAEHCVVAGEDGLRFLYGFPQDRFSDVEYRFSAEADPVLQAAIAI
ncbi:Cupin domain protein [Loktanella sp. DSM 29012]|uniref:cupin domain-containing protein n=1 Tax=Loktanella sp. DSM 29012 TaxID=1881056 RepID=UPI0008CE1344|nr:cupin domain-containing protein [Loktanella sp. DSM 29012]SEP69588.1 Cupin domain protein [Loktanella sp. DSM 29012]